MKAHKFVQQGCVFIHHFLATSMTDSAPIFTGLLFHDGMYLPLYHDIVYKVP